TTTPHLHFEIHPQQFLKLKYDGAVDPTAYLKKWRVVRVPATEIPQPAKLKAPRGTPAQEASVVWHQLLLARHLLSATRSASSPAFLRRPFPQPGRVEAPGEVPLRVASATNDGRWFGAGIAGVVFVLSAGAVAVRRRRRSADDSSS